MLEHGLCFQKEWGAQQRMVSERCLYPPKRRTNLLLPEWNMYSRYSSVHLPMGTAQLITTSVLIDRYSTYHSYCNAPFLPDVRAPLSLLSKLASFNDASSQAMHKVKQLYTAKPAG